MGDGLLMGFTVCGRICGQTVEFQAGALGEFLGSARWGVSCQFVAFTLKFENPPGRAGYDCGSIGVEA